MKQSYDDRIRSLKIRERLNQLIKCRNLNYTINVKPKYKSKDEEHEFTRFGLNQSHVLGEQHTNPLYM